MHERIVSAADHCINASDVENTTKACSSSGWQIFGTSIAHMAAYVRFFESKFLVGRFATPERHTNTAVQAASFTCDNQCQQDISIYAVCGPDKTQKHCMLLKLWQSCHDSCPQHHIAAP